MTWTVVLAKDAEKQFNNLNADRQELILKHLREMREDPFRGDVKPLKGKKWKGRYRKRIGQYRLIFVPRHAERIVEVSAILTRSERTYE
jgi:mRNA-degrading endonuclease RelE of RelBE toxin-antitoxin system